VLAIKQSPDHVAAGEQPVGIVGAIVPLLVTFGFGFGVSIFQMYLGKAIKAHKEWSRMVGIILAFLALFAFPIGTLIGGYILWCLIGGWSIPDSLGVEPSPAPDASSR
jgi:protein-S-isoprenylcysteine O-methyltransferase Ste14